MEYSLYQKNHLFQEKWFKIDDDGLAIRNKQFLSSSEYYVKFEDIGFKMITSKSGTKSWLIVTVFLAGLSAFLYGVEAKGGDVEKGAYLFYLFFAVVCFFVYLFTYKRLFYLAQNDNSNAIAFLIDKPSKIAMQQFMRVLKEKRDIYLVSKYGQISMLRSYEQQQRNIFWLNSVDALSNEDYLSKLQQLNDLFKTSPGIGEFHLN